MKHLHRSFEQLICSIEQCSQDPRRPKIAAAQPAAGHVRTSVVPPTSPTPADRFARLVEGLCRAIAARGGKSGLAGPLMCWSGAAAPHGRPVRRPRRPHPGRPPAGRTPPLRIAAPRRPAAAPPAAGLRLAGAAGAGGRVRRLAVAAPARRSRDGGAALRRPADGPHPAPALPDAGRPSPAPACTSRRPPRRPNVPVPPPAGPPRPLRPRATRRRCLRRLPACHACGPPVPA